MEIEIAKLQRDYIGSFAEKESELKRLAEGTAADTGALAKALHKIAGSGGTYRMQALTTSCRALELALLRGKVTLPEHRGVIDTWFRFFAQARKSYEKLAAQQPGDDGACEKWHDAVERVDAALQQLWDKVAASHAPLQTGDEEAA